MIESPANMDSLICDYVTLSDISGFGHGDKLMAKSIIRKVNKLLYQLFWPWGEQSTLSAKLKRMSSRIHNGYELQGRSKLFFRLFHSVFLHK